jgi:hypothetical protein
MDCDVSWDEANILFTKKNIRERQLTWDGTVVRDTVPAIQEIYHYTPEEFITMLHRKCTIKRESDIFKITPNMYCTWKTFDQIYTKYVK